MIENFHLNFLARSYAMDQMSKFAGLTPEKNELSLTSIRLERSPEKRRSVVLALLSGGYLGERAMGEKGYPVTNKALSEVDPEAYEGTLNVGTTKKPLACWLSAGILKQALIDLTSGASIISDTLIPHTKVVVSAVDCRTKEEVDFSEFLLGNFQQIVLALTDMSDQAAKNLRFDFGARRSPESLPDFFEEITKSNQEEIQRMKRQNDVIVVLADQISEAGGFRTFLDSAKELYTESN